MRAIFSILSTLYIAGIFILPRIIPGSIISKIWNPYSLLHIPMYGALMILLVLTFEPNIFSREKVSSMVSSFFLPGGIATAVGILDEIHQAYIPDRDASVSDVVLDIVGILLFGIFAHFYNHRLHPPPSSPPFSKGGLGGFGKLFST